MKSEKKALIKQVITMIVVFTIVYVCTLTLGERPFLHDVEDYWLRGEQLWRDGKFSLNIGGYRGYVFPLYLGMCSHFFGGVRGWEIMNSLNIALFFTFCIPKLFRKQEFNGIKNICFTLLYLLFCYGTIVNPSSDIIALELCLISQLILNKIMTIRNKRGIYILSFLFGINLYWTYNVRTIYMFACLFLIIEYIYICLKKRREALILFLILCMLVGVFLATIPQFIINYREHGIISPMVVTNGLFTLQLLWGLKLQRYDTTISDVLGTSRVCFVDRSGMSILQKEGIRDSITYGQYFKLFIKYPMEMIGLYVRHFVNLLLPIYPENFIANLNKKKIISVVMALLTGGGFGIGVCAKEIRSKSWLNFFALFIPILFIIPGSIEQRFGIGIYVFIIGAVCFEIKWKYLCEYVKINKVEVFFLFLLFSGLLITIWTSTLASVEILYPPAVNIDYPIFLE